ncbi:MAG: hypothetical protein AAF587_05520 [Bacteroidota bacterium]
MFEFYSFLSELLIWDSLSALSTDRFLVYLGLFGLAFVKFAVAALAAMANQSLNFVEIFASVGGGALVSVVVYTFFGQQINRWIKKNFKRNKPASFARKRQMYKFWKKYGILGAAALAPFISPMVSVGIAVSFQESPKKIIGYTSASIILWTIIFGLMREGILELVSNFQG